MRRRARELLGDKRGIAAVEFAMIVPVMLVLFFGVVEFSSGVAVDRKVTLMARTLSDLTSQNDSGHRYPADQLLQCQQRNHDALSVDAGAMPRSRNSMSIPLRWRRGCNGARARRRVRPAPRSRIPTALKVGSTYLIFSEVSYKYVPTIGYVMAKAGINLSDFTYHPSAPVALRYLSGARLECGLPACPTS